MRRGRVLANDATLRNHESMLAELHSAIAKLRGRP